jgi:hypothetical protein
MVADMRVIVSGACCGVARAQDRALAPPGTIEIKPVHVTLIGSGNFGDETFRCRGQTSAWA